MEIIISYLCAVEDFLLLTSVGYNFELFLFILPFVFLVLSPGLGPEESDLGNVDNQF